MVFIPSAVPDFLELFDETSSLIRSSAGCRHLELWQDVRHENIFTTYSIWTDAAALEAYRSSELFRRTWDRTKRWFAAPPVAHSQTLQRSVEGAA